MLIAIRSRLSGAGLAVVALVTLALTGCAGARSAKAPSRAVTARSSVALRSCPRTVRGLGMIAFAASGRVELVDLANCRATVLARGNPAEVRFSPDGRWVAYSRLVNYVATGAKVVSVQGGRVRSPLGAGIIAWQWAPKGELLYGITGGGSLIAASPTGARRIVSAHLGLQDYVGSFGVSPDGKSVAVDPSTCGPRAPVGELDTINVHTGARSVVLRQRGRFFTFAGWSPDGRWLVFWSTSQCSSSIAADGLSLEAVPAAGGKPVQVVRHMLLFSDFLSWCGTRLIAAAGPDRETQLGSALVETQPPAWRDHTLQNARKLSWVSPDCAPSGRLLAAAAGLGTQDAGFGLEHRSIWLLGADGAEIRQLTSPPARYLSDEAPRFSDDARWILFVRSRVVLAPVGDAAISRDTIELVRASRGVSPAPIIDFTSDDFSYYDHFDWPDEIDWYQPSSAAGSTHVPRLRLTVKPAVGYPTTRLVVEFTAQQSTGGSLPPRSGYFVTATERCGQSADDNVSPTREGERVRLAVFPAAAGPKPWCLGLVHGLLRVWRLRACQPKCAGPAFRTLARFTFRVVKPPGAPN